MATTPVNLNALDPWLDLYENVEESKFLRNGFINGFSIEYAGSRTPRFSKNHKSAFDYPEIVQAKLDKEVRLGRVAGPFKDSPYEDKLIVSPIGLVQKKSSDDYRLIFDLSFPEDHSINDGIPKEFCSVNYTQFDEAIDMVLEMGPGSYLSKIDIQSAFRLIPLNKNDFPLLGMFHNNCYYIDKCLPFGCSISCAIFEKFSTFLEFCLKQYSLSNRWIHYLDDFLSGDPVFQQARKNLQAALDLFERFGVPISIEKLEGPTQSIVFLGIEIDTKKMQVRLPKEKQENLLIEIEYFIAQYQKKVNLRQLQSLIGKLSFACRAILPGRAFLRRIIDTTIGLNHPRHHKRVSFDMLQDLLVWKQFLHHHNGTSMILSSEWLNNESLEFFTDASGAIGFGIYFQKNWIAQTWPNDMITSRRNITFLELYPIALAVYIWGPILANKRIIFHCDNLAVVNILSRQTSKDKDCMILVRYLVLTCLKFNILLKASHLFSSENYIADFLSRQKLNLFRKCCPDANQHMTPIPDVMWSLLVQKSVSL